MFDSHSEHREDLRWEYREVATGHRFYVGLRFVIAVFTGTLQAALLKLYSDARALTAYTCSADNSAGLENLVSGDLLPIPEVSLLSTGL